MTLKLTKTALAWCLGKGSLSIRGSKRRPWLEIKRDERERAYLSYQLFSLRRAAQGPSDDVRDTLTSKGFYDTERIRFTGEGLDATYRLLYPRDKRLITAEVLGITGLSGLTALWLDQSRINSSKRGILRGKYSTEELKLIAEAFREHGIKARYTPRMGEGLWFDVDDMKALKKLLAPYVHRTMQAKLMLRKPRSKPNGSQSSAD